MSFPRTQGGYTNGEIVATVAPIFNSDPSEIGHAIVIILSKDGRALRTATTECARHTASLILEVGMQIADEYPDVMIIEPDDFDPNDN